MLNITYRPAKPEDAEQLFSIKKAAYGDEFELFNYKENGYKDAVDDCESDDPIESGMFSRKWHEIFCSYFGDWSLVIEADGQIIGQIVAIHWENQPFLNDYSEYDMTGTINVIFCIYVSPECKNKGLGKMAMDYMERLHPTEKWILDTPKVSLKNRHFYEKCGYKHGTSGSTNVYAKGFNQQ